MLWGWKSELKLVFHVIIHRLYVVNRCPGRWKPPAGNTPAFARKDKQRLPNFRLQYLKIEAENFTCIGVAGRNFFSQEMRDLTPITQKMCVWRSYDVRDLFGRSEDFWQPASFVCHFLSRPRDQPVVFLSFSRNRKDNGETYFFSSCSTQSRKYMPNRLKGKCFSFII